MKAHRIISAIKKNELEVIPPERDDNQTLLIHSGPEGFQQLILSHRREMTLAPKIHVEMDALETEIGSPPNRLIQTTEDYTRKNHESTSSRALPRSDAVP